MLSFSKNHTRPRSTLTLDDFINHYLSCTVRPKKNGNIKGIITVLYDDLWRFLSQPGMREQFKNFLSDATHPKRNEFISAHHFQIAILTIARADSSLLKIVLKILQSEFGVDTSEAFENLVRPYYNYQSIQRIAFQNCGSHVTGDDSDDDSDDEQELDPELQRRQEESQVVQAKAKALLDNIQWTTLDKLHPPRDKKLHFFP